MDSFEWNKVIGAVLGTVMFIFVIRLIAEAVYEPATPAKPGYIVEGVVENAAGGGSAAPVEETVPDFGTVLASADVAAGSTVPQSGMTSSTGAVAALPAASTTPWTA